MNIQVVGQMMDSRTPAYPRVFDELAVDLDPNHRLSAAFTELALAI